MSRQRFNIIFVFSLLACGQSDSDVVKEQAELLGTALLNNDFETMLKYNYPRLTELNGGRDKAIENMRTAKSFAEKQGIVYDKIITDRPQKIIKVGNELQCLIPRTVYIKSGTGNWKLQSNLIGTSPDNGTSWYFIDTSSVTVDQVKVFFPSLSDDLKIPTQKAPEKTGE